MTDYIKGTGKHIAFTEAGKAVFFAAVTDPRIDINCAIAVRSGAFGQKESGLINNINDFINHGQDRTKHFLQACFEDGCEMIVYPINASIPQFIMYGVFVVVNKDEPQWVQFETAMPLDSPDVRHSDFAKRLLDEMEKRVVTNPEKYGTPFAAFDPHGVSDSNDDSKSTK